MVSPPETLTTDDRASSPSLSVSPWNPDLIRAAAEAFYACLGIMFPIYERDEIEGLLTTLAEVDDAYEIDVVESRPSGDLTVRALRGEVAAMTAVGLQYSFAGPHVPKSSTVSDVEYSILSRQHYECARSRLDDCLESNPLKAVKVVTLLVSIQYLY
jgi:hypothetical protein